MDPDPAPAPPPLGLMGLRQFFSSYAWPAVFAPKRAAAGTLKEFQQSLGYWAAITGDPPLESIDQAVCAAFVAGLEQVTAIHSPNTVRKHCTQIQRLLDLAGPKSRRRQAAAAVLQEVPYIERPPAREDLVEDYWTLAEVALVLESCRHARWPRLIEVRPPLWWDSLVRFLLHTGVRIDTTLKLRWSMVQQCADGVSLVIPAEIYKGRRHGLTLPLTADALHAIQLIRTGNPLVFPWGTVGEGGHYKPYRSNCRYLHQCLQRLLERSSLPAKRRFAFHALRKTLAAELSKLDSGLAQQALGHTAFSTTAKHYIPQESLRAALAKLPTPPRAN